MRNIYILLLLGLICFGCNETEVGYLKTENAGYLPNELVVRKTLDPEEDAKRIENNAPWVTGRIQGVLGTNPLIYDFVSVKAPSEKAAEIFTSEIVVRGSGILELPLQTKLPVGDYVVTLRVSNEGYSDILSDVFTFSVQE